MGVFLRRNVITIFMCVELMLNAVNLSFIAFSRSLGTLDAQVLVFFVLTVAAAEAAVGLAIVIAMQRHRDTLDVGHLQPAEVVMTAHDAGHPDAASDAGHPPVPTARGGSSIAAWVLMFAGSAFILRSTGFANFDMVAPFLILLMPLLGFVVLSLFGDAIRDHGEGQGASVLACMTVLTSFALSVFSVRRLTTLDRGAGASSASPSPTSASTGSRPAGSRSRPTCSSTTSRR